MDIKDFDYELPEELIAQHPVEPRDSSRLLLMDKNTGTLEHKAFFRDIVEELGANDVLVFNDTKVLPARLFGVLLLLLLPGLFRKSSIPKQR